VAFAGCESQDCNHEIISFVITLLDFVFLWFNMEMSKQGIWLRQGVERNKLGNKQRRPQGERLKGHCCACGSFSIFTGQWSFSLGQTDMSDGELFPSRRTVDGGAASSSIRIMAATSLTRFDADGVSHHLNSSDIASSGEHHQCKLASVHV